MTKTEKHGAAKNIVPDRERAELVRKAFELVAEGSTLANVLRIVTSLGCVRVLVSRGRKTL